MALKWNGDKLLAEMEDKVAQGLLRGAVFFQTTHRNKLNRSNPRPYLNSSKPGEYPRARTGFGRDNHAYQPTTIDGVKAEKRVRIGYNRNAFYMLVLEMARGRKGLKATLDAITGQLKKIVTGG